VRGLAFATLRRANGYGLGVRTERGVLDVVAAEQEFRENAPTTIDAVFKGEGDINGLKRLIDKASAANHHIVAADRASFGPCVTNPEKIICIGLNYRRHAAEVGQQVPKQPIPLKRTLEAARESHARFFRQITMDQISVYSGESL